MNQASSTPPLEVSTALRRIAVGLFCLWVPTAIALAIRKALGLDGLVAAGVWSLGLSALSVGLLWFLSSDVRAVCAAAWREPRPSLVGRWLLALVAANLLLAVLVATLYRLQLAPSALRPDVGWSHYFSLPADRRPDFLLHYLLLSAAESSLVGPVAEEFFHVGVVVWGLRKCQVSRTSVYAVNAVLFALLHFSHGLGPKDVVAPLAYAGSRIFLDWLFFRTGNIAVPIVAHVLHNLRVLSVNWLPLLP